MLGPGSRFSDVSIAMVAMVLKIHKSPLIFALILSQTDPNSGTSYYLCAQLPFSDKVLCARLPPNEDEDLPRLCCPQGTIECFGQEWQVQTKNMKM